MPRTFEIKGYYVAVGLVILTGIVGALFIVLGPKATEKSPGVLHVGVRYSDELSIAFTRYGKTGPGASIEFLNAAGERSYRVEHLKIGRNLVPIGPKHIPSGQYTARLSAPDYETVELPVVIEGRMLNPPQGATYPVGIHADYNMIGVRFEPLPQERRPVISEPGKSVNPPEVPPQVQTAPATDTALTVRAPDRILTDPVLQLPDTLQPRTPHPKRRLVLPPGDMPRITIKFMDAALARITESGALAINPIGETAALYDLVDHYGVRFFPAHEEPERLEALRLKAAQNSGEMPPDLNGTMHLTWARTHPTLEVAQAFLDLPLIESVGIESLDQPPPPPSDISPITPDLSANQGYLNDDPGFGVTVAHALGIYGQGVRFSNCEYGYDPDHEDLVDANITYGSAKPFHPDVHEERWDQHGTSVMGLNGAPHNGYGIDGIAPDTVKYFYSEYTTDGWDRVACIESAVLNSSAGDVVLLEMQKRLDGQEGRLGPAELDYWVWNITKTASDAGIIIVAAAGNGNEDLGSEDFEFYMDRGDSGAIIVGAGSSNTNHTKRSTSTYGSRVNVQAWGDSIYTLGDDSFPNVVYGDDPHQGYRIDFDATSGASACVAGVVCLLQSYAKNVLGTLLTPAEVRSFLASTGFPQTGNSGNVGPAVSIKNAIEALPDHPLQARLELLDQDDLYLHFYGLPFRNYSIQCGSNPGNLFPMQTGLEGDDEEVSVLVEGSGSAYFKQRFFEVVEE